MIYRKMFWEIGAVLLILFLSVSAWPKAGTGGSNFEPLDRWGRAVVSGDQAALRNLYSTKPPAVGLASGGNLQTMEEQIASINSLRKSGLSGLKLHVIKQVPLSENVKEVFFQAELRMNASSGPQTVYFTAEQLWMREKGQWRIVNSTRTELSRLRKPDSLSENLYPANADAEKDIHQALARAAQKHKRVLVAFGANWCYDCHVLDLAFHHSDLTPLLEANYEVVHVDVGEYDRNLQIAERYNVPLNKGIPALAVLDQDGHLLFSQSNGEFEAARRLGPEDIVRFLNQWKPQPTARN